MTSAQCCDRLMVSEPGNESTTTPHQPRGRGGLWGLFSVSGLAVDKKNPDLCNRGKFRILSSYDRKQYA